MQEAVCVMFTPMQDILTLEDFKDNRSFDSIWGVGDWVTEYVGCLHGYLYVTLDTLFLLKLCYCIHHC